MSLHSWESEQSQMNTICYSITLNSIIIYTHLTSIFFFSTILNIIKLSFPWLISTPCLPIVV